jgi:uncharacterized ferritin-like protein (DUF455 family)
MQLRPLENSDKITYFELGRIILEGENLSDKFFMAPVEWGQWKEKTLPLLPGRSGKIVFSDKQVKFPKMHRLHEVEKKALAIHSFANHELLAIEMMAAALLIYPHQTDDDVRFKKGILTSLKDEQKHLLLYIGRLNQLGFEFGDFPLNDFFWRQMEKLRTMAHYSSVMALTFEAANLDFAQFYARVFQQMGDQETASILETVLEDEIAHVAFGAHWMKKWRGDKSLWDYYQTSLPWPITPARSKGIGFDPQLHQRAINDEHFILQLCEFDDQFNITKRTGQSHEGDKS